MIESKNRRKNPDRRKQKIKKFQNDKRQTIRREEDVANIRIYYYLLSFLTVILFSFGIAAYLH